MLGGLFAALRPVLAVLMVGGAAVVMVAPAADMASQQRAEPRAASAGATPLRDHPEEDPNADPPMVDFETLLHECLGSRDPDSDQCAAAVAESGLSYEEFRAQIVAKLEAAQNITPVPASKPEPTKKPASEREFWAVFENCLDTRDVNSDICFDAQDLIGFSDADFIAKFDRYLAERDTKAAKAAKATPKPTKKDEGDFWTVFEKCLDTRDVRSEVCLRAQALIGFSDPDFQAKFGRYLAERDAKNAKAAKATPKPQDGDFWPVFERCLDTREVRGETCRRAQQLIGYSDTDFGAKFERYLAERDAQLARSAKAAKPAPKSLLTEAMTQECVATHEKKSDPCIKAQALSGIRADEFWAKLTAKYGAFR